MFPTCSEVLEVIHNLRYRKLDGSSSAPSVMELVAQ